MDWLSRWREGKTGWHEADGNPSLHRFWPSVQAGRRVLVPLCGKTPDLLWLAQQGLDVTGVELCEIAAEAFFREANLGFTIDSSNGMRRYSALDASVCIFVGDYFEFEQTPFDALYDRAALVALPPEKRPEYINHTKRLLKPAAQMLLVTLEYEQSRAGGPPYSVEEAEVREYWPGARRMQVRDDIDQCPPRFRDAGIETFCEVAWLSE
jgi:thiopurine S-methyltransferase